MYSRNIKNTSEEREYPFTLPERYGGSRFRQVKEPTVHVHTETSIPQTPSPIHLSPIAKDIVEEEQVPTVIDTIEDVLPNNPLEEDTSILDSPPSEQETATVENSPENASLPPEIPSTFLPIGGFNTEDLLLIGLILLLTKEGEDTAELPILLALLLAYRPSENK